MEEHKQLQQFRTCNSDKMRDHSLPNMTSNNDGSHGHMTDSGYTSYYSFNNISSLVAHSGLATIDEDNEADNSFEENSKSQDICFKSSSILTPTTAASIEQISNFHLTTPTSDCKRVLGISNERLHRKTSLNTSHSQPSLNSKINSLVTIKTPSGAERLVDVGNVTPRKNKATNKRKGNFREKLYTDEGAGMLQHSDSLEDDCKKLEPEDISPIFHAKRRRNSVIDDLMRSSTPKTASFERCVNSEARENIDWDVVQKQKNLKFKPRTLRKIQSFSPSKMTSYKSKRDTVLQEKSITANRKAPLLRQNALNESPLKSLILPSSSPEEINQSFTRSIESYITPVKGSAFSALIDAPILPKSTLEANLKEFDIDHEICQVPSFGDFSIISSKQSISEEQLPSEDSLVVRDIPASSCDKTIPSILEIESSDLVTPTILKTPISSSKLGRLKRLSSQSLSSSKKDKTKQKSNQKLPLLKSPSRYRRCYYGFKQLNILKRLNEQDKDALEIVLNYLSDSDLVCVVAVSRGWRSIIESHPRFHKRLQKYLDQEQQVKENLEKTGSNSSYSFSSRDSSLFGISTKLQSSNDTGKETLQSNATYITRQPFSLCNSIDRSSSSVEFNRANSIPKSPPVSPSRRKFRDNQKLASILKNSERLRPCPRCEKPSRVVPTKSTARYTASIRVNNTVSAGMLEKAHTLPETIGGSDITSSPLSPSKSDRIRRNLFSTSLLPRSYSAEVRTPVTRAGRRRSSAENTTRISGPLTERKKVTGSNRKLNAESHCDYAICNGKSCGFVFCVKCLCKYHPETECKDLAPNSPSKEDDSTHNVACSKQSRRSLLRLRK